MLRRDHFQFVRDPECVTIAACGGKGNRDLRPIEWAVSGQTCRPLQFVNSFAVQPCLNIVLSEQKVGGCEVRVQFNRVPILLDCAGVVTCHVVAEPHPRADHEIKGIEF